MPDFTPVVGLAYYGAGLLTGIVLGATGAVVVVVKRLGIR